MPASVRVRKYTLNGVPRDWKNGCGTIIRIFIFPSLQDLLDLVALHVLRVREEDQLAEKADRGRLHAEHHAQRAEDEQRPLGDRLLADVLHVDHVEVDQKAGAEERQADRAEKPERALHETAHERQRREVEQ